MLKQFPCELYVCISRFSLLSQVPRNGTLKNCTFLKNFFKNYCIAPHHAQGMFKREINRRWGLIAARAWARLLIELIHILVLGFDDVTELGAQAR
jgi:hypothetical protein